MYQVKYKMYQVKCKVNIAPNKIESFLLTLSIKINNIYHPMNSNWVII
jgi:hypothetical protein